MERNQQKEEEEEAMLAEYLMASPRSTEQVSISQKAMASGNVMHQPLPRKLTFSSS